MDDNALFPEVPKDLASLDADALAALRDEHQARIREVYAGRRDVEIVGERTQPEVTAELAAAVEGLELIKAEITQKEADEAKYEAETAELASKAGIDPAEMAADTDADTDADSDKDADDETDADADSDADADAAGSDATVNVQAAAKPEPRKRPLPAA